MLFYLWCLGMYVCDLREICGAIIWLYMQSKEKAAIHPNQTILMQHTKGNSFFNDHQYLVHTISFTIKEAMSQLPMQCFLFLFLFLYFLLNIVGFKIMATISNFFEKLIEFPLKTIILQNKPKKRKMLLGTVSHETTSDPTISLILFLFLFLFFQFHDATTNLANIPKQNLP